MLKQEIVCLKWIVVYDTLNLIKKTSPSLIILVCTAISSKTPITCSINFLGYPTVAWTKWKLNERSMKAEWKGVEIYNYVIFKRS